MRRKKEDGAALAAEIWRVQAAIRALRRTLDEVRDPQLFAAAVYELKTLEARHAYLWEQARRGACTGTIFLQ